MNIYIPIFLWRWSERPLKQYPLAALAVPNTVKILKCRDPNAYQLVYHYKTEFHRCFSKLDWGFSNHLILRSGIHATRGSHWCSELSGFRCSTGTGQQLPRKAHGFVSQFRRASLFRTKSQSIAPELTHSCTFLNQDFRECLHKQERKRKERGWVSLLGTSTQQGSEAPQPGHARWASTSDQADAAAESSGEGDPTGLHQSWSLYVETLALLSPVLSQPTSLRVRSFNSVLELVCTKQQVVRQTTGRQKAFTVGWEGHSYPASSFWDVTLPRCRFSRWHPRTSLCTQPSPTCR